MVRALTEYLRDASVRHSPMGRAPDPTTLEGRRIAVEPRYAERFYPRASERFEDAMPERVAVVFSEVLDAELRLYDDVLHCEEPDRSPYTCTFLGADILIWITRPSIRGDRAVLWLNVMMLNPPDARWPFTNRQREVHLRRADGLWEVTSDRTVAVGGE